MKDGDTLHFHLVDDELIYLTGDGGGGGVCIELAKERDVSDARAEFCHRAMSGLPLPHK